MKHEATIGARAVAPTESFVVRRLSAPIRGVRSFQARYEAAVPRLQVERVSELLSKGAPWSEIVELMEANAPHGFAIYFTNDVHRVMSAAGDTADCIAYLMGNHVIAESIFRHDPRAFLYVPLRTLLWEDSAGKAWFTIDQPSCLFSSFGIPEVQRVGEELDAKVAQLLEFLEVPVPEPLVATLNLAPVSSGTASG